VRASKRRSDKPLGEGVGPPRDAGGKRHVVERNGEVIVANAKYKARVSVGDVERMAAYIVDVATPLRADGERLIGVLVMLTGSKPKTSKVVADEELTTKHELRVAHVNPSEEHKLDNVKTVKEVLLQATR
jgi:hypothetical protein